ncbi:MAG: hypothetical protein V3S05_03645 [Desulfobacterales bacterium]
MVSSVFIGTYDAVGKIHTPIPDKPVAAKWKSRFIGEQIGDIDFSGPIS